MDFHSIPRYASYVGPLFSLESYDGDFGHMWKVKQECSEANYATVFVKLTKYEGSEPPSADGVFFMQEWDLSLNMHYDMFPDEEHILRVSYELDFQTDKDKANL